MVEPKPVPRIAPATFAVSILMSYPFALLILIALGLLFSANTPNDWEMYWKQVHFNPVFRYLDYLALPVALLIAIWSLFVSRQQVESHIGRNLSTWLIVTAAFALHAVNTLAFTSYFTEAFFPYSVRLSLFLPALILGWRIKGHLDHHLMEAYEADLEYTAEYRRAFIKSHHSLLLSKEQAIYHDYQQKTARWRLRLLSLTSWPRIDIDRMLQHYREPVFLLKLAKCHYSGTTPESQSENPSPQSAVLVPSVLDPLRVERDVLQLYFQPTTLTEYMYRLSRRFIASSDQEAIADIARQYRIDTTLTDNQRGQIDREIESRRVEQEEESRTRLQELKLRSDDYVRRLKHQIESGFSAVVTEETDRRGVDRRNRKLTEFQHLIDAQTRRRSAIADNTVLSAVERKETLRLAEVAFLKQLDDFQKEI